MKLVLGSEAELAQTRAELQDPFQILFVGEELEGSEFKELPLLVDLPNLSIDVLLDLLGLLVKLDQLAIADGIVVGVNACAAADNVEDGVAALGRDIAQLVLKPRVATRDGLVGDLLDAGRLDGEGRLVHLVQRHDTRSVVHGGGVVVEQYCSEE